MSVDIYEFDKAQVFLSYTRDDRALVANFVDLLKDKAIAAAAVLWYDTNLTPAREWDDEIIARLNKADVILVLASPKFFESPYCTERELPVIRQRAKGIVDQSTVITEQPLAHTPVRVIRLRAFDEPRPEIESLDTWPDADHTLENVAPDGREISELRTWLKVEICKALVRRHADRYHHRSREEEIRRQNEDLVLSGRPDDLTFLHHELGVPVTSKPRLVFGVFGGLLVGAASGLAIKTWLLPGAISGFFRPLIFFALLGFVLGLVKPGFRGVEMLLETFRSRRNKADFWSELRANLSFIPFVVVTGLVHLVILGAILGIPLGAVLSMFGWNIDMGLVGSAAIGGLLCSLPGFDFAHSFRPKQLKVFTDVQHLYQPPIVEPLPQPSIESWIAQLNSPVVENNALDTAPLTDEPAPETTEPLEGAAELESEEEDSVFPKTPEQVTSNLTIVASGARPQETSELLAALQADYCDDVFQISVVTDTDPQAYDPTYWKQGLANKGRCIVLMTTELLRTPIPAAVAHALANGSFLRQHKVYPVLVDVDLPISAPLMSLQGLPTGQLPVQIWPVRANAWRNVTRNLFGKEITGFLISLSWYLEHVLLQEKAAQLHQQFGESLPYSLQLDLMHYQSELMNGEWLVDPKHDLSRFEFKHRTWYWLRWSVVGWVAAGTVCLGSAGRAFAGWFNNAGQLGSAWIEHVVPMFALTLVLAYLVLRETLGYAKLRIHKFANDEESAGVLPFLLGARLNDRSGKRRPIVNRVFRLLLPSFALLALITIVTLSLSPHGYAFGYGTGAAVGLACYLLSRYRVPTIVVRRRHPPTPYNTVVKRKGLKWTICIPREHYSEARRGRIGKVRSPSPRLIESYYEEMSVSVGMLLRAFIDAVWIIVVATIPGVVLFLLGVHPFWAMLLAVFVMSFIVHFLKFLPGMYMGWKAGFSLWEQWRAYRFNILRGAFLMHTSIMIGMSVVIIFRYFIEFGNTVHGLLFVAVVVGIPFCMRLYHQVIQTSQSHYPESMPD